MNTLMNSLFNNLTVTHDVRNGRFSSWDHRGKNQDYWVIPPHESITLGQVAGPGCIKHIWMTSACRKSIAPSIIDPLLNADVAPVMEIAPPLGVVWDAYDPFYYRKALIKMTWDNEKTPSVLAPLGDFFCIGNSYPGNFTSLPFNVSLKPEESGKYGAPCAVSCYFPMPFQKKAKIEIVNENNLPFILYFNIDFELYKHSLPKDTTYFHASWHRENPTQGWGDDLQVNTPEVNNIVDFDGKYNYTILDTKGKGQYVGCNLTVRHFQGSWWGEGNDMFFIDGEKLPSLNGTGTEDYFNHGWGMQRNAYPFYGSIVHEGDTDGFCVNYRFHITDPVYFNHSIKVSIEHGHANQLSDDWSSTAYWYQTLPTLTPITIAPVQNRIPNVARLREPKTCTQPLTDEMRKAKQSYENRWKVYKPLRDKTYQDKEERTRKASKLNIQEASELRQATNKS